IFHAQIFPSETCTLPPSCARFSRGKDRILNENGLFSTSFLAENEIVDFWGGLWGWVSSDSFGGVSVDWESRWTVSRSCRRDFHFFLWGGKIWGLTRLVSES